MRNAVVPLADANKQALRIRRLLLVWSGAMVCAGVFWGVSFALRREWGFVAIEGQMAVVGAVAMFLTRRGAIRNAVLVMVASVFFTLCMVCVLLDIPSVAAPRSTHLFFLAVGMATFLMFRGESWWLRHGITLLCFSVYLFFASSSWGWMTSYMLPDEVRVPWTWGTNAFGLVLMYILLHVMQSNMVERHGMAADLQKALRGEQFVLHYQPQLGANGRIVGAEALVRWRHPVHGMVSPAEFIPVAEETGLILPLGQWVLDTACAQLVVWSGRAETAELTLAINVSAGQFQQPDYAAQVVSALQRAGADPARLKLELTESMLANDVEDIIATMTTLKSHGVRFSLDDFGTGYSSLSYLKRLPLDQLKIDQSFVRDVLTDPNDAAIARTVVALGQTLGLDVIAEGVETARQQQFLAEIGCRSIQGYLVSRPLPAGDFEAFIVAYGQGG